ncbi:hypothetical protein [Rahnella aceris]|uniref:hypothetical protein n=1 Tax=Rahnella sp. (strain Y9602) TaxID=2703885 RepID=UPI00365A866C
MSEGINSETFPEEGRKISIHGRRRLSGWLVFWLTTFTAVFYWFTLNRDEPFFGAWHHSDPRGQQLSLSSGQEKARQGKRAF